MSSSEDAPSREELLARIKQLEEQVDDEPPADEGDRAPQTQVGRRSVLGALAAVAGVGALSGQARAQSAAPGSACTWRGDQNAAGYNLLGLGALGGDVTNGNTVENLAGDDLAIDSDGNLNVDTEAGGEAGLWTEEQDGEVTTSGGQGVDVPAVTTDYQENVPPSEDESGIQSLIDNRPTHGQRITLGAGEFSISSGLVIDENYLDLEGQGWGFWGGFEGGNSAGTPGTGKEGNGVSKLKATASEVDPITVRGNLNAISLRNLYIYGNGYTGWGVRFEDGNDQAMMRDVMIHNTRNGVFAHNDAGHYYNISVMDIGANETNPDDTVCLDLYNTFNKVKDCTLFDNTGIGVALNETGGNNPATQSKVIGNDFGRQHTGVKVYGDVTNPMLIGNSYEDHFGPSIEFTGGIGGIISCETIDQKNGLSNSSDALIEISDADSLLIQSPTIMAYQMPADGADAAIRFDSNCNDCQLWGHEITGTSQFTTGQLVDNGTRTVINGVGTNNGDPNTTGEWNGNGIEGLTVYDTSVSRPYTEYQYVDGAWQSA